MTDDPLFEQIPLILEQPSDPGDNGSARRRVGKSQRYDDAILRYVGFYRWVTVHQIVDRFFVLTGKDPRPGFRVVKQLIDRRMLNSELLDPGKGRASRQIVRLTDAGWQALGIEKPPREGWRVNPGIIREFRLQFAETMLVRNAEGWRLVRASEAPAVLREWAVKRFGKAALAENERTILDRLRKWNVDDFPLWLLRHATSGDVRLGAPIRRGKSFQTLLNKLPNMSLFPTLTFEIVTAEPDMAVAAEAVLKRWSERTKQPIKIARAQFVRDRVYPSLGSSRVRNVFAEHGLPDPLTFSA